MREEFGILFNYGFIDSSGKQIVEPKFKFAHDFSEGLATVKIKDKWGFINKKGETVIDIQFDSVGSFSEGLAVVAKGNEFGFINKKGKKVLWPKEYQ